MPAEAGQTVAPLRSTIPLRSATTGRRRSSRLGTTTTAHGPSTSVGATPARAASRGATTGTLFVLS